MRTPSPLLCVSPLARRGLRRAGDNRADVERDDGRYDNVHRIYDGIGLRLA